MPRIEPELQRLKEVRTFPSLIKYLKEELNWPIPAGEADDVSFSYEPSELGFNTDATAKIEEVKQLRPLDSNQKWGIFWVKFGKKQLPVQILRRALGNLVVKKRASSKKADRAAWEMHDLLFISAYGDDTNRHITFAHFSESEDSEKSLPVLKVLGWDDDDTLLHLKDTYKTLVTSLNWENTPVDDPEAWREHWSAAFKVGHREVINTTKELVVELAQLATVIKKSVLTSIKAETDKGPWKKLMLAFQKTLIKDLNEEHFADVIAQTVSYGLLTARLSSDGPISLKNLVDMVPSTNPFLKELLKHFLTSAGMKGLFDVDEAGINDVVELLNRANAQAIRNDFGKRTDGEDPVIHFYEHFLGAYNKKLKVERGVFYTPQPVVSYIVRSVHELLQKEFGLEDGLADTSTWAEVKKKNSELKIPVGIKDPKIEPFVLILDPATGTATFLIEVIDVIHNTMTSKWDKERVSKADQIKKWNIYVPTHLLPRLYAYELMMAPYAIAHMKVGLKLTETGFTAWEKVGQENRANIFLTNALDSWETQPSLTGLEAIAKEAAAVNHIKKTRYFTVIIGNPPYSPSMYEPEWLMTLLEDWKKGLNETKSDINREEWKFLRLAQYHCQRSGGGITGYISNRDFLDGIAKRVMREHLSGTFPLRVIIDLNGDVKGNVSDGNVFNIAQGVAIGIFSTRSSRPKLMVSSRVGTGEEKCADLSSKTPIDNSLQEVIEKAPYYRWVTKTLGHSQEDEDSYTSWINVKSIFVVASSGIQTKRDSLCIAFSESEIKKRVKSFSEVPENEAFEKFDLTEDGRDWTVAGAQRDISENGLAERFFVKVLYKPFDFRFTYWTGKTKGFLAYPRREVMQHVIGHQNIGLIFNRQIAGESVSHFGVSDLPIGHGTFYLGNKGQDYFAPLYLYNDDLLSGDKSSNVADEFIRLITSRIPVKITDRFPENLLGYIYAIFHSNSYRTRYSEYIKLDFPKIPLPNSKQLFEALSELGDKIVKIHLLKHTLTDSSGVKSCGVLNKSVIESVSWSDNTIWINKDRSIGFSGIKESIWKFEMGGYQVLERWLKTREGLKLSKEDIEHYHKIVVALSETIRLMAEIDKVIDKHGGWPGAFQAAK